MPGTEKKKKRIQTILQVIAPSSNDPKLTFVWSSWVIVPGKKRSIYIYEEERKMAASFQSLSSNNQLLLSEGQGWLEC